MRTRKAEIEVQTIRPVRLRRACRAGGPPFEQWTNGRFQTPPKCGNRTRSRFPVSSPVCSLQSPDRTIMFGGRARESANER